jgi:uncharacterized protein YggE
MRRLLSLLVTFLPLTLPVHADEPKPATLSATGEGVAVAVPDIAVVTIGVISNAHTAQAALASNSSDMAAVIATIKAAGIEDKDIGNTGFNLNPIYPPERRPSPEQPVKIIGYRVCNDVRVIIRDFAKAGDVLAAPFDLPSLKGIIRVRCLGIFTAMCIVVPIAHYHLNAVVKHS